MYFDTGDSSEDLKRLMLRELPRAGWELRSCQELPRSPDPVTIINDGGVVSIRAPGAYAGIEIRDSRHLRITGSGVATRCGARHTEAEQECGIRITGSDNGLTGKVRTEHLTVDHVEVGDVASAGMGVHDKELRRGQWVQEDVAFRDVYLHDIATEGHYHGASSYTDGSP